MQNHISSNDHARYRQHELSVPELLALDDHLAGCADCRQRLMGVEILDPRQFIDAVLDDAQHPDYDVLEQLIDGKLGNAEQKRLESHTALCKRCAAEVDDLRTLADHYPTSTAGVWISRERWAIAASVVVAAGLLFAITIARSHPSAHVSANAKSVSPRLVIRDASGVMTMDSTGRVQGAPLGWEGMVGEVLTAARLSDTIAIAPSFGPDNDLLRGSGEELRFRVVRPVRTVVVEDTPLFEWAGGTPNATFTVEVFDSEFRPVAHSAPTTATEWRPKRALPRGRQLQWQAVEIVRAHRRIAPHPPDSPARFFIVDGATAEQIAAARSTKSHLILATIYARSGVYDAAQAEIDALVLLNPHSSVIARLRDSLRAHR